MVSVTVDQATANALGDGVGTVKGDVFPMRSVDQSNGLQCALGNEKDAGQYECNSIGLYPGTPLQCCRRSQRSRPCSSTSSSQAQLFGPGSVGTSGTAAVCMSMIDGGARSRFSKLPSGRYVSEDSRNSSDSAKERRTWCSMTGKFDEHVSWKQGEPRANGRWRSSRQGPKVVRWYLPASSKVRVRTSGK